MDRKEELIKIVCQQGNENKVTLLPLINQIIFMENKLDELKQLPFYKFNPDNPQQQKMLPAFKIYKEMLQQYTNCIKVIGRASGQDMDNEESPLRKWANKKLEGT